MSTPTDRPTTPSTRGAAASRPGPLAALLAASVGATALAQDPSLTLVNGETGSNALPAQYSSIALFGTGTTYTADATLTLTGSGLALDIGEQAQFVMNADVNAADGLISVSTGGSFRMNAGMLTANTVSLYGSGSFIRTGGSYALGYLLLASGATITYEGSDSVSQYLSLQGSSTITLAKDLAIGSLQIAGGSTVERAAATISANDLSVSDANFTIRSGDSFNFLSATGGAVVGNDAAASLANGLYLGGTNSSGDRAADSADALLAVGGMTIDAGGVFVANADVDATGNAIDVRTGGEFRLNAGTTRAGSLSLAGAGSMNRSGGAYDVEDLALYDGASIDLTDDDSVSGQVNVFGGSSLSLGKDLDVRGLALAYGGSVARGSRAIRLSEGLSVTDASIDILEGDAVAGAITVNGGGAVRNAAVTTLDGLAVAGVSDDGRASTYTSDAGLTASYVSIVDGGIFNMSAGVAAQSFNVARGQVNRAGGSLSVATNLDVSGAAFELRAGDSIGGDVRAFAGATVRNSGSVAIGGYLVVAGDDGAGNASTYAADAAFAATGVTMVGGRFDANADVDLLAGFYAEGGRLNLNAGTLSAQSIGISGTDSITRAGGRYATREFYLNDGAVTTFGAGDSIASVLGVTGPGSMLTSFAMLELDLLQLSDGGLLRLAGFTGSWNGLLVGLQMYGDQVETLNGYRDVGLLEILGSPADVQIAFDFGTNTTYVAMIPAPGTILLLAVAGSLGRRGNPARRRR